MDKFVVRLDATVIPENHQVYKCFPGKNYRFVKAVYGADAVFLDIRGLENIGEPKDWSTEATLKAIADDRWSRELDREKSGYKKLTTEGVGQTDRRNLTFLRGLLFEAKKGDLVVIPGGGYTKDVLIGSFTTDPGEVVRVNAVDDGEERIYLGRPVKWLAYQQKRLFDPEILKLLHSPSAFHLIPTNLRHEIYELAYENFVRANEYVATFRTSKAKFTAEDSAVVSVWLNAFDALRNLAPNEIDQITSFYALGMETVSDGSAAELTININSPGTFILRSASPFALALMVLLSLGGCDAKAIIDNGVAVELRSVDGSSTKGCEIEVEEQVKAYTDALGYSRLTEACKTAHRATTDATLSTGAHLKSKPAKNK